MSTNTQVVPQSRTPQKTIRTTLNGDYFRQQVAMCLPKHLTPERFIRMALTALMRTPKLADCTEASVTKCMLTLSELGIEPDGRRAHLIPFENKRAGTVECTLIVDWKGLAELTMRSGLIAKLHADVICDKDEFAYDLGDILHHRINFREPRGNPYAAYAMAVTKDGQKFIAVMTKDEIEKIRDKSQGWYAFKQGWAKQSPWQDSPGEMWKKTAFRRLSKWLPLSPEIQDGLDKEENPTPSAAVISTDLTPPDAALPEPEPPVDINSAQNQDIDQQADASNSSPAEPPQPEKAPETPKPAQKPARGAASTAQSELEKVIIGGGHTWDDFARWGEGSGNVPDCTSLSGFAEVKEADAKRLLRAKQGMLDGIAQAKGV